MSFKFDVSVFLHPTSKVNSAGAAVGTSVSDGVGSSGGKRVDSGVGNGEDNSVRCFV